MKRTIKLKLALNRNQKRVLINTIKTSSEIFEITVNACFKHQSVDKGEMHELTYQSIRESYPSFKSALLQSVRDRAIEALRGCNKKSKGKFDLKRKPSRRKFSALRYNQKSCKIDLKTRKIAITHAGNEPGRIRTWFYFPNYYQKYKNWIHRNSGDLVYRPNLQEFFFYLVVQKPAPPFNTDESRPLGVDRGIVNIAACSDGTILSASKINHVRARYAFLRRKLQKKNTRSARRRLRAIGRREQRFTRNMNHVYSKQLANKGYNPIVLENLRHIRKSATYYRNKFTNRKLNNWAFYQLEKFLQYKTEELGKKIAYISPKYTSIRCSACGHTDKKNRPTRASFKCKKCGFEAHADINASYNIAWKYMKKKEKSRHGSKPVRLPVNQPHVLDDELEASIRDELTANSRTSFEIQSN